LCSFIGHGRYGTGESLAMVLRPGNAGSNTVVDGIAVITAVLAELPGHRPGIRAGHKVPIRTDGAGSSYAVPSRMVSQRLTYSVGFTLPSYPPTCSNTSPRTSGSRRKERPNTGVQLTITDIDGHRITAFVINTRTGGPSTQLADLETCRRRRARCEDRIRIAKDTELRAFPVFDSNLERDPVRDRRPRRRSHPAYRGCLP